MSWHYLREQAGESLEDICSSGEPLPPLKSKTTHGVFYSNGKLTESYLDSLSGTMSVPSTESPGAIPAGGSLNPTWVEWLMGWPLGWTELQPLAMDKYLQWLRSHGVSCETDSNETTKAKTE